MHKMEMLTLIQSSYLIAYQQDNMKTLRVAHLLGGGAYVVQCGPIGWKPISESEFLECLEKACHQLYEGE